jgi:hypothetical protein
MRGICTKLKFDPKNPAPVYLLPTLGKHERFLIHYNHILRDHEET